MYKLIKNILLLIFILIYGCSNENNLNNPKVILHGQEIINDTTIFSFYSYDFDIAGNLYITDRYNFNINKFDINTKKLLNKSVKGAGPGEFRDGPYKIKYDKYNNIVAVTDYKPSPYIHLFDNNLNFLKTIYLEEIPIAMDITFNNKGNLIVSTMPSNSWDAVLVLDINGKILNSFKLSNVSSAGLISSFKINFSHFHEKLIVSYTFRNLVQVYDLNGVLENEFKIEYLPDIAKTRESTSSIKSSVPVQILIKMVQIDEDGHIYFLLGDDFLDRKNIIKTDLNGNIISNYILNESSSYFNLYGDVIYANHKDRSKLFVYNIK